MSPWMQCKALAELEGWSPVYIFSPSGRMTAAGGKPGNPEIWQEVPDYLHDLNAMNHAEGVMNHDEQASTEVAIYRDHLTKICGSDRDLIVFASAAQRAEALLKTKGKWDHSK